MNDKQFMFRALQLAYSNLGNVSPNPSVGAVIVRDGKVIAEGITQKPGSDHAEIVALKKAGDEARGATLYVTLEPCSHINKRTPPCVDAIIKAGVGKVVVGVRDKNPKVEGVEALRKAGIEVAENVLAEECWKAHEFFFHWIKTGMPLVAVKAAMTIDGKMSWGDGQRKKITGAAADRKAHELRRMYDAVLVGVETVIKDDPLLTCRYVKGRNPVRVVLDSSLRMPADAKMLQEEGKNIIFYVKSDAGKENALKGKAELVKVMGKNGKVDIKEVLKYLGKNGITSLLVEGGAEVISSFLNEKKAQKGIFFVSPKSAVGGKGFITAVNKKDLILNNINAYVLGEDIMVEGYYG